MQEPEIILADEPIASLDPRNTKVVMDALLRINHHYGITVMCNLHSLDLARTYCDRLIGMSAGRVVFDGVPEELTEDVAQRISTASRLMMFSISIRRLRRRLRGAIAAAAAAPNRFQIGAVMAYNTKPLPRPGTTRC